MARNGQAKGGATVTLRRHMTRHLGTAAINVAIVVVAMLDFYLGVGAIVGIVASAVAFAIRDHRRDQKHAAEAADLDRQLAAVVAKARGAVVSEERWS